MHDVALELMPFHSPLFYVVALCSSRDTAHMLLLLMLHDDALELLQIF